jgi:hypothetical protein
MRSTRWPGLLLFGCGTTAIDVRKCVGTRAEMRGWMMMASTIPFEMEFSPNPMVLRSPFWDYSISPALGINRFEANQGKRTLGGSDAYTWLDYPCARDDRRDAKNTSSDL